MAPGLRAQGDGGREIADAFLDPRFVQSINWKPHCVFSQKSDG